MTVEFTTELVRRIKPALQSKYEVQGPLPLDIKLRLERLKLAELIRQSGDVTRDARPVSRMDLALAV